MLTRRLQRFLKVVERPKLVRLYFAGNNEHSNLLTKRTNVSQNLCFTSRNIIIPISKGQELTNDASKRDKIISRSCQTETDDDTSEQNFSENGYAYNVLLNSKIGLKNFATPLEPTTIKLSEDEVERILTDDWENFSANDVLLAFEKLSGNACLNPERFVQEKHREILQALSKKLGDLDDEKFRRVFQCLWLWKDITWSKCAAYTNLWLEMDNECLRRLSRWSTEETILMCDHWYRLRLIRKVKFSMMVMRKLGKNPRQLNPGNFLHFMFIINMCRKPPINMYELEYRLSAILDEFTANELGVVAMSFFKTQTPFRDPKLVSRMHLKMLENLEAVDDISISAIMKMTRYSTGLGELNILQNLLHSLTSRVPRLSIPCLTNVAHAAAYVQCYDEELMKATLERFEKDIDDARIKDLERLSWVLNIFDYDSETPIYQKIIDSMRDPKRTEELVRFPTVVPTTLGHLSYSNIFPTDLIKQCFSPDFLQRVYNNNAYKIGWDFFTLENNVRIDMPEYDGPFLKPNVRNFLSKKFTSSNFSSNEKIRPADQFIVEVAHMCKSALESETSIIIEQVLPHYVKPDIIVCFDEANNSVNPQPFLSKLAAGTIKRPPPEANNLKWFAIVLATQNQIIRGTNRYVGAMKCKIRQLEKIGYTPVVISIIEWHELSKLDAKKNYLRKKLLRATDNSASAVAL